MFSFFYDVYGFVNSYNFTDYISIFNDTDLFDANGKSVLDLFYLILFIVRHEHGAYDPVEEVLEVMNDYKLFSTISIDEAINRIIEVEDNKRYYVVSDVLYCVYNFKAYQYLNGSWIECDYLSSFDNNELEKISESNAIDKFGLDAILGTLKLF